MVTTKDTYVHTCVVWGGWPNFVPLCESGNWYSDDGSRKAYPLEIASAGPSLLERIAIRQEMELRFLASRINRKIKPNCKL